MIRFSDSEDRIDEFDLSAVLKSIFQEGGWLEDTLDFEHRSEQFKMAKGIEKALLTEDHLWQFQVFAGTQAD